MKPCPFCGGDPHPEQPGVIRNVRRIVCGACGAGTDEHYSEAEAADAWNKRTPPSKEVSL